MSSARFHTSLTGAPAAFEIHAAFDHIIVGQPSPEAAAAAGDVHRHLVLGDAQGLAHQIAAGGGVLRRSPDRHAARADIGGAVLRLQGGVGEEGVEIGRLHHVGRAAQGLVDVTRGLETLGRAVLGEGGGLIGETLAALACGWPLVPFDLEDLARPVHPPPVVADDGDATEQTGQIVAALDDEGVLHAGLFLDLVEVGAGDLAAEYRTFDIGGVQHAGHDHVDAEQRLAVDDLGAVHSAHGLADDDVVLGVLQRDLVRVGRGQQSRLRGQIAIAQFPAACPVDHHPGLRRALGDGNAPGLGRRADQHRPRAGPGPTQRIPVHRRRQTAPGELRAVFHRIQRRVLDLYGGPSPRRVPRR